MTAFGRKLSSVSSDLRRSERRLSGKADIKASRMSADHEKADVRPLLDLRAACDPKSTLNETRSNGCFPAIKCTIGLVS